MRKLVEYVIEMPSETDSEERRYNARGRAQQCAWAVRGSPKSFSATRAELSSRAADQIATFSRAWVCWHAGHGFAPPTRSSILRFCTRPHWVLACDSRTHTFLRAYWPKVLQSTARNSLHPHPYCAQVGHSTTAIAARGVACTCVCRQVPVCRERGSLLRRGRAARRAAVAAAPAGAAAALAARRAAAAAARARRLRRQGAHLALQVRARQGARVRRVCRTVGPRPRRRRAVIALCSDDAAHASAVRLLRSFCSISRSCGQQIQTRPTGTFVCGTQAS
eukprot:1863651-Pleurochrysis_carterae.AAC.1